MCVVCVCVSVCVGGGGWVYAYVWSRNKYSQRVCVCHIAIIWLYIDVCSIGFVYACKHVCVENI